MTYKQIEASREVRLWIGQVIVPAVVAGTAIMSNPNAREIVTSKFKNVKNTVTEKVRKVKEL